MLIGLQSGRSSSWDRFVSLYGTATYTKCRRRGLSDADAQEVCQEFFLKVHRSVHTFRRDPPRFLFRKWLASVFRTVLADFGRLRQRQPTAAAGGEGVEPILAALIGEAEDDSTFTLGDQDLVQALRRLLAELESDYDPRNWQAFWLSVVEEVPTTEVAERLGMSLGNLRQIKLRIFRRIRDEFAELFE